MSAMRPQRRSLQRRLEIAGSLLVVLAAARFLSMFFHRGANLLDEGSQVAMANRILHGEVIYRDFLTVATPGSFYTVAWLFQIFGTDLMVVRWAVMALNLGIVIVTLSIARHLMSWPFAAASALLAVVWGWFLLAPNLYSLEAMFFALLALAYYLHALRRGESWLFVAGLSCGVAMMVKQNIGFYAATGLALSLAISSPQRRQSIRNFGFGAVVVVVPVLLYLIAIGAGPHLYENWVYYPLQRYPQGLAFAYPPFFPFEGPDVWQKVVLSLPWFMYPGAVVFLIAFALQRRSASDRTWRLEWNALLAVTLFGALTFLQAFPRADLTHILFGMAPAFILLGYFCFKLSQLFRVAQAQALGIAAVVLALVPLAALIREGYSLTMAGYETEYVPLTTERARGIRTSIRNAAQIDQVTAYLRNHTSPNDPIFVVPWAAGFYFLADRPNPTRFDVLLYGDPDEYPCLIATLDDRKPAFIVYGYGWDVDGKRFSEYAQPVDSYIRTRYQLAERFDEFELWRRLEAAQPAYDVQDGACRRRVLDGREFRRMWRQLTGTVPR